MNPIMYMKNNTLQTSEISKVGGWFNKAIHISHHNNMLKKSTKS